jgi:dihydrofolate synthase/folylpolyglutamate synthase
MSELSRPLPDWLTLLEQRHPREIDLGLGRCGKVYAALGSPRPATRVTTVAGTNGKGSTVAYLDALLRAGGRKTGTYTSPHLLRFNERVRIGDVEFSDQSWVAAFEAVEQARADTSLTYFEFTTLAAFVLMAAENLDDAVLEVGLGGRLDTVNLVDCDFAIITPVGLDHQAFLGNDRETIGAEKAAVMRPHKPVICGDRNPPLSVLKYAQEHKAPVFRIEHDYSAERVGADRFVFRFGQTQRILPMPSMGGAHQLDNLATALAANELIQTEKTQHDDDLASAIESAHLPGRLQTIVTPAGVNVLIDVGHNPMAARAVRDYVRMAGLGKCRCVIGMLQGKDSLASMDWLAPFVAGWFCCDLQGSRARTAGSLEQDVLQVDPDADTQCHPRVDDALNAALKQAASGDTILVFGSFLTAAGALRSLQKIDALHSGDADRI